MSSVYQRIRYAKNKEYPYPNKLEKQSLEKDTKLSLTQIEDWFKYKRRRYYKV